MMPIVYIGTVQPGDPASMLTPQVRPGKLVDPFYASVPSFARFADVVDRSRYRPVPANWVIAVTDVVNSTGAIAAGRYKAVNMVGASVISAVLNGLKGAEFPFVFGGDGAALAVPAHYAAPVGEAMAAVAVWAKEEIDLTLRAAIVPISAIRAAGFDVAIARFSASTNFAHAMFEGGGIDFAEREMKSGRYLVRPAAAGTRPDLEGLSCRWEPMKAKRGSILSILATPQPGSAQADFAGLVSEIIDIVGSEAREATPVPVEGPPFGWPPSGLALEAKASPGKGTPQQRHRTLFFMTLLAWVSIRFKWTMGGFNPVLYRETTGANTDFRKFADGLKMTVDCDPPRIARIENRLERARKAGIAFYGLHRQDEAIMTCIVPSILTNDHMHFVDGAAGGYASAAAAMKIQVLNASIARPTP
jgi:Protein of unknown function (DUF3095)